MSDANYGEGKILRREVGGGAERDEKIYKPKGRNERVTDGGMKSKKEKNCQETLIERVLKINTLLKVSSCQSVVFNCCVTFLHYFELRANREDRLLLFVIS